MKSIDLALKTFNSKKEGEYIGYTHKKYIYTQLYIEKLYGEHLHYKKFCNITFLFIDEYGDYKNLIEGFYDADIPTYYSPLTEIPDKIILFYKKTNKRFTLYPIHITDTNRSPGHVFFILYDKKYNKIEVFDNNNYIDIIIQYKYFVLEFKKFFKRIYGNNVKFNFKNYGCILSNYELIYCKTNEYLYKSDGYCSIWFLWFLEVRLKNRQLTVKQIVTKIKKILEKDNTKICKILIGYAQFVDKFTSKYKVIRKDGKFYRITQIKSITNKKSYIKNKI